MTGNKKVLIGVPEESLVRLKPQKLGRNYHTVPAHIKELSSKRPQIFADYFHKTYRTALEPHAVIVHEHRQFPAARVYQSPLGQVGFAIDRALLSEVMECYYGGATLANREGAPVTSSEQRMLTRLGTDAANLFARLLLAGETFGELTSYENSFEETQWEYVAEFSFTSQATEKRSSIFIYLDSPLVDVLTSRLTKPAASAPVSRGENPIKSLPVRLNCVVAAMELPLADVLKLRTGDILSVRLLDHCDVEISQQKLFRGHIYEDDGALLLTSLESVKTS